jgi:2-polyprenyl-3-methyl-5-hydroxy-6-metoxy-1,4-benzoquinol methylase
MECHICSSPTSLFGKAQLLHKYEVQYYQCECCGFIQTEKPYWLDEAYSEAITKSDLGLVSRNIALSRISKVIIQSFFNRNAKFLDYGGGYGMLVRMMRDFGFDFYRSDKFCDNLLAAGFDADREGLDQYELVTAFEVFEHLVNPLLEIEHMLQFSKNILFTTLLLPATQPKPSEWWYFGLEHGQHIAFYTPKSLAKIAEKFHLNIYSNGDSLHLLTEKKVSPLCFNLMSRDKVSQILHLFFWRKSLLAKDYSRVTGKMLN